MQLKPSLRAVFVAVNLAILAIPLGGVFFLRLYESVLIRRTEGELGAQGAVLAAVFAEELDRQLVAAEEPPGEYGRMLPPARALPPTGERFRPLSASLDLTLDPVLPDDPEAAPPRFPPDPLAQAAGERVGALLPEVQRVTLAGIRLVDGQGAVVATTGNDRGGWMGSRGEVLGALHGERVALLRRRTPEAPLAPLDSLSRSTRVRVYVAMPVVRHGRVWGAVLLGRTPMSVLQSLYGIRGYVLAAAALLLLLVTGVSLLMSFALSRPVRRLVARTERVAGGERGVTVQLERPGTREIGLLSAAIERMTRTLEQRADYIRAFASSVSHEFKTPLASMRGAVELIRDHLATMSPVERDRFLANLADDVARLDRLVGGLLALARADVLAPGGASCRLGDVVDALPPPAAPGGDLVVDLAAPLADTRLAIGGEALGAVLANLIGNARIHGGAGVRLTLGAGRARRGAQEGVEIAVGDDGRGIPAADQVRVFEPFFTTARASGGTGLGLAIARSLLAAHGGSIELRSRPGETVFTLWVPSGPAGSAGGDL